MKPRTTLRITEEARKLLEALAQHKGLSQTAVMETLIREAAKKEKIKPVQTEEK